MINTQHSIHKLSLIIAICGVLALALALIGAAFDTSLFFKSYLFSYLFWIDLPLGALPMLMIYHLTDGNWGVSTKGILEALSSSLFPFVIFCLPILFFLDQIYPWMDPKLNMEPGVHHQLGHKLGYLNAPAFGVRTGIYFACWLSLNYFIKKWSDSRQKLRRLCAGGLFLFALVTTFASIDWQMSVEPNWYSTVYGMVFSLGQVLQSYAFALVVLGIFVKSGMAFTNPEIFLNTKTLLDVGNILLTLVIVWAYLSFMQYLIIWSGNLPHEVIWFNHRSGVGWQTLTLILVIFQFSAPFIFLLFRPSKKNPQRLALLGGLIVTVRIVDHYWMLMPGFFPHNFNLPWEVFPTWVGIGGIWLALFIRKLETKYPNFHVQKQNL